MPFLSSLAASLKLLSWHLLVFSGMEKLFDSRASKIPTQGTHYPSEAFEFPLIRGLSLLLTFK